MKNTFAVIMAGGSGQRFWPCSRQNHPKQFLDLTGDGCLIEQTVQRLQNSNISCENILIVTNRNYAEKTAKILSFIPEQNIICEPCARDTAPCVALAAGVIKSRVADPEKTTVLLLPSDHFITNTAMMLEDLQTAADAALAEQQIVTIGITPDFPSPDYGYIEIGEQSSTYPGIFRVKRFIEKPSAQKAEQLLLSGNFKWNAGMFIFPLNVIENELHKHVPSLYALMQKISAAAGTAEFENVLAAEFPKAEKISIDYAVMEKSSAIMLREATFQWADIGNWTATRDYQDADTDGNVIRGKAELLNCKNCIVYTDTISDQLVTGIDLENMIIIKTGDAILVVPEKSTGKIKQLLANLSSQNDKKKYL